MLAKNPVRWAAQPITKLLTPLPVSSAASVCICKQYLLNRRYSTKLPAFSPPHNLSPSASIHTRLVPSSLSPVQAPTPFPSRTFTSTSTSFSDAPKPQGFIPAFVQSLRRQLRENQDFQKSVKQLNAETNQLMESDAMQSARSAMEQTSKAAQAVGQTVQKVIDNPAVKKTAEVIVDVSGKVGEAVQKVAEPIMDTKAAKTIASGVKKIEEQVVDSEAVNPRYVEYRPKEERDALKRKREAKRSANPLLDRTRRLVSADPNAGTQVVLHRESRWAETWKTFSDANPLSKSYQAFKRNLDETDSPILERIREIFASPVFNESEHARVVRSFLMVDPTFSLDKFTSDLAEFVVPDIMEAYLKGDSASLEEWCSERAHAQLTRGFEVQERHGLISDCKLLDLRRLELVKAMIIEDAGTGSEVPVLTFRFTTQEVLVFRKPTGEIALGKEDNIVHSGWVIVFTKDQCIDPTIPINPKTQGWRVLEAAKTESWNSL